MSFSLGELAVNIGCELIGNPDVPVNNVASITDATSDSITFLSNKSFVRYLPDTKAAAVILHPRFVDACPVSALVTDNPYAAFAQIATFIHPENLFEPEIHSTAVISSSATVDSTAYIAANTVIGDRSTIGKNTYIGPGSIIGEDCQIGNNCRLIASVNLVKNVKIGDRGIFHPGLVVGADGFGNARTQDGWIKVPQLGGVTIGDDVEIGSNTTVDCGTLENTIIDNGVRIDNLCMIAHNVHIGEHTAMAASTAIAGSVKIGKNCIFGGRSGAVGHISICDNVTVHSSSVLTKDVTKPGVYSGTFPAELSSTWARKVARFRRFNGFSKKNKNK